MTKHTTQLKIAALFILSFLGHSLYSQTKTVPKIKYPSPTGFGKFKIGKTTIQELNNSDTTYSWFMQIDNKIDSTTGAGIQYSDFGSEFSSVLIYSGLFYGKDSKMGLIKEYKIANDKVNLVLIFSKDTLVKVTTADFTTEIQEQWNLKYGNGAMETTDKTIKCTNKFGAYSETETYIKTSWGSPTSKIQAIWKLNVYFDSKCKKQYMNYFVVESPIKVKLLESSSTKHVSGILLKIEEKKKKQAIDSDL